MFAFNLACDNFQHGWFCFVNKNGKEEEGNIDQTRTRQYAYFVSKSEFAEGRVKLRIKPLGSI